MSGPGVGFQYPAQPVSWLKRDVLLFANSIGAKNDELHFLYELHPNFQTFPTYPVILSELLEGCDVRFDLARYTSTPFTGAQTS